MTKRKPLHRTETWKGKRVRVTRNARGRFVTWHKIRHYTKEAKGKRKTAATHAVARARIIRRPLFGKCVAVYGTTVNTRGERKNNRIELYGSGKAKYRAVRRLHQGWIPREPYTVMDAEDLSEEDIERGRWLFIEVKS